MSIQAVMISTPQGKLIFYRNYAAIHQSLFEDFAFSLPQSMKKDSQHTFAIHGQYRLIYLPIEGLLLSLVTCKNSNILEDIDTVAQTKEIVSSIIGPQPDDTSVFENYVDLALAFDDMVNLNSRNAISKTQIAALLEMESNNEKMHNAMQESKEKEAMRKAEEEVKRIERTKKVQDMVEKELKQIDKSIRDYSGKIPNVDDTPKESTTRKVSDNAHSSEFTNTTQTGPARKGIQLGKKPEKKAPILGSKPSNTKPSGGNETGREDMVEEVEHVAFNPLNEEIRIVVDEKISGEIGISSSYTRFELKGTIGLFVENPDLNYFNINTNNVSGLKHLSMKLPPNFDRTVWNKGILAPKSKNTSLPKRTLVETVKYALTFNSFDEAVPFNISIWLAGPQVQLEIEFNENQNYFKGFQNLAIHFRKLYGHDFSVSEADNSSYNMDNRYLVWSIPQLDSNTPSASIIIDFESKVSEDEVFPADIELMSNSPVLDLKVHSVVTEEGREVKFALGRMLSAKDFHIA
jgi:hypothetical protein